MPKRIKKIILSILLLLALIIIVLPFFQKNNYGIGSQTSINPPPFPEQSASLTSYQEIVHQSYEEKMFDLKKPNWVVHIGTFNDKDNARQLVNRLRQQGYRAFIQNSSNVLNDQIKVFVGPELKRTSAMKLAKQIKNNIQIQGRVVSYQPLVLGS